MRCFHFSQDDWYQGKVLKSKIETDDSKSHHEEGREVALTESVAESRKDNNSSHIHFVSLRSKLLISFLSLTLPTYVLRHSLNLKRLSFNIFCGLAQIIRKGDMM